jgi:Cu/Ag efflux protein CusF
LTGAAGEDQRLLRRSARARFLLAAVFVLLLVAFAAGLWGTIVRPAAYEVRGEFVARAAAGVILVRHEAVSALGMSAMEMMAITADPALVDPLGLRPGDRVRLAVRPRGDDLVLVWIERVR